MPSGQEVVFRNRVSWANTYLKKAGLLQSPRRGYFSITERGKEVLSQNLPSIGVKLLSQFPEFQAFKAGSRTERIENKVEAADSTASQTPLELLEAAHENIRAELAVELLDRIKKESPSLFERIVIELLVKMGQHANKGIFITTSDFSREAYEYVSKVGTKIVLIDGSKLAELMIDFGVGVTTEANYEVKRIDADFFESI